MFTTLITPKLELQYLFPIYHIYCNLLQLLKFINTSISNNVAWLQSLVHIYTNWNLFKFYNKFDICCPESQGYNYLYIFYYWKCYHTHVINGEHSNSNLF